MASIARGFALATRACTSLRGSLKFTRNFGAIGSVLGHQVPDDIRLYGLHLQMRGFCDLSNSSRKISEVREENLKERKIANIELKIKTIDGVSVRAVLQFRYEIEDKKNPLYDRNIEMSYLRAAAVIAKDMLTSMNSCEILNHTEELQEKIDKKVNESVALEHVEFFFAGFKSAIIQ